MPLTDSLDSSMALGKLLLAVTAAACSALRQKFGGRRLLLRRGRLRSRKEMLIAQEEKEEEEEEGRASGSKLQTLAEIISMQLGSGQAGGAGEQEVEGKRAVDH